MKKIVLLAAMLLGTLATYAQTDDYTPLVREGSEWCYLGDCYQSKKYIQYGITVLEVYHYYRFEGDTVAYNHKYKILNRYETLLCERSDGSRFLMDYEIWEPFAFVREENKKVYACQCRSHVHRNTGYDEYSDEIISTASMGGIDIVNIDGNLQEALMYDFNDLYQYFVRANDFFRGSKVASDTIVMEPVDDKNVLNGKQCYKLGQFFSKQYVVEGIGQFCKDGLWYANAVIHMPRLYTMGILELENLVYMKNPQGEFEYLDEEMYSLIEDVGTMSAVTDVKVPTRPADDRYYNLMGQPVAHPEDAPGIYIHEGKKVRF